MLSLQVSLKWRMQKTRDPATPSGGLRRSLPLQTPANQQGDVIAHKTGRSLQLQLLRITRITPRSKLLFCYIIRTRTSRTPSIDIIASIIYIPHTSKTTINVQTKQKNITRAPLYTIRTSSRPSMKATPRAHQCRSKTVSAAL